LPGARKLEPSTIHERPDVHHEPTNRTIAAWERNVSAVPHSDGNTNTRGFHARGCAARCSAARADIDDDAAGIFIADNRPVRAKPEDARQAIAAAFWLIANTKMD